MNNKTINSFKVKVTRDSAIKFLLSLIKPGTPIPRNLRKDNLTYAKSRSVYAREVANWVENYLEQNGISLNHKKRS